MAKITDEHKKEMMQGEFIPEGIHQVKIMLVEGGKTQAGKDYVEFTVVDSEEREGKARMWFTTDNAIGYTFNIIRGIFVHNAPANSKDKVRETIDAIDDTDKLVEACQQLIGKEAWLQVKKSDRTYQNEAGETKHSYDKNIYGYEPVPKSVSNAEAVSKTNEPLKVTDDEGNEQLIAEF